MKLHCTRRCSLSLISLSCGFAGWWLRDCADEKIPLGANPPAAVTRSAGEDASATPPGGPGATVAARAGAREPVIPNGESGGIQRMRTTDPADMLAMLEAIGAMTRMTDAEARQAWRDLAGQTPSPGFGNSLGVLYLWARMTRMGESVDVPPGWGAEQYEQAIETEKVRGNLASLRTRMEAGDGLSEAERRIVLTDTARQDPLKAVELWSRATLPADFMNDAKWLTGVLERADQRDAIMARLREWQAGGNLAGAVSMLANRWIAKDPAAVEKWLQEPAQADIRDALMVEVANARALTEPAEAWEWSKDLQGSERLQALRTGAMQLAERDPESGIELIAALDEPAERETAVKNFANILAARDFDRWQEWRDSLPAAEQDMANESAFALWVNMDAAKAAGWLSSQPEGAGRDGMVGLLVNYYAGRDPETCSEWIRTIADADRRREAAGAALSNVGPYDLEKIRVILAAATDG
jgi:hypothetical protein